jgi:phage replication initiation protein
MGLFNAGGRNPQTRVAGDWLFKTQGRTLYLGSREAGKLTRIYEKGKQVGGRVSQIFHRWTRIEVEILGKNRVIPWRALIFPGQYLAAVYPAFSYLSVEQCRLKTIRNSAAIDYDAMVHNLRVAGGKAINVMTEVHQGDVGAVISQLIRPGEVPKRLAGYPVEVLLEQKKPQQ